MKTERQRASFAKKPRGVFILLFVLPYGRIFILYFQMPQCPQAAQVDAQSMWAHPFCFAENFSGLSYPDADANLAER